MRFALTVPRFAGFDTNRGCRRSGGPARPVTASKAPETLPGRLREALAGLGFGLR